MAHANARLTEFGRLLLVQRITELGWPAAQAAQALGVSRATADKWLARYRSEGRAGLADRSSRARRCPMPCQPARSVGCWPLGAVTARAPSPRLAAGPVSLDHLRGAGPPWHASPRPPRPDQRRGGALPA
jgi:leucine-zipper of insertion element IS481